MLVLILYSPLATGGISISDELLGDGVILTSINERVGWEFIIVVMESRLPAGNIL